MIIRSGLIRNRDGVEFESFTEHWRNVHAPLVVKIDGLRAYSQNHIVERRPVKAASGLHRVDGVSQLYFDDVTSMKISMASIEQEACIVDLRGFLSDVTLLIQQAGEVRIVGGDTDCPVKLLYLLHCDLSDADQLVTQIRAALGGDTNWKYRINPIIERDIVVDKSISAGEQIVDFVMEFWTQSPEHAETIADLIEESKAIEIISGLRVEEFVVLPLT